jgi:hypothetical protein
MGVCYRDHTLCGEIGMDHIYLLLIVIHLI